MATSLLLSLPEELLAAISELITIDSLLSFALTCSETYRHTKPQLIKHQEYHNLYKIQHDRRPLPVADLLRLAINNHEAFWHLKAFESWGLRPGWRKWKTFNLGWHEYIHGVHHEREWPGNEEDFSGLAESHFTDRELDSFRTLMTDRLYMSSEVATYWDQKLREGWDEPIKGLLFALAPRLDRLNFIAYDSWQSTTFHDEDPLKFLAEAISSTYHRLDQAAIWPPGFQSLRMVSICTSTDLRHPHDAYYASASRVAPLFLLPNIKVLNLTLLGYMDEPDPEFSLPPACSSVEELTLSCCDITLQSYIKLITAPKRLRSFLAAASSMRNEGDKEVFRVLAKRHGHHLERLSLGNYKGHLSQLAHHFPNLKELDRLQVSSLLREEAGEEGLQLRPAHIDPVLAATEEVSRSSV